MPRSEAGPLGKDEPNFAPGDRPDRIEPGRRPRRLHRAERAFRWIAKFQDEPNFLIIPVKISA